MKDVGRTNSQTEGATSFAASSYTVWSVTGVSPRSDSHDATVVAVERSSQDNTLAALNEVLLAH